jgi:LAO/AO transport system kinase
VGQSEVDIVRLADLTLMVTAPGLGDDIQAMKAGILEVADLIVINKADQPGAESAALCMEAVLQERGAETASFIKVHQTIASEGKGVAELLGQIKALASFLAESGELRKRRLSAHNLEVFDWTLELLKPLLKSEISARGSETEKDPRVKAKEILSEVLRDNLQKREFS